MSDIDNVHLSDMPTVHNWFELSYAHYLTIPRSVLEAMPDDWQVTFTRCLFQLDEMFDWRPKSGNYWCRLKNSEGKFAEDPLMEYRRPNWEYIESIKRTKRGRNDL